MRPPVCEVCDGVVDETGGLVRFQPDDRSREWRRRAETEVGFVGHPPDTGWFCGVHIDVARDAALTSSFSDGMRVVQERARRVEAGEDLQPEWLEWGIADVDVHALAGVLLAALPTLFVALQLGEVPTIETRTERRWNPMDGAEPPFCPFTDTTVHEGASGHGSSIEVSVVLSHWSEDEVASAHLTMSIGDRLWIGAFGSDGGGRAMRTLRLHHPTSDAVAEIVARLTR